MKPSLKQRLIFLPFLLLAIAASAIASDAPRVSRDQLVAVEKLLDSHYAKLWEDNELAVLGPTRGIYLEGYGAVMTSEVNPVAGPTLLFMRGPLNKDEIEKFRQKKIGRLPELRKAMRQALIDSATALDNVPAEEQIVVVTLLSKYPFEDVKGLPKQIMMQAQRKRLVDAQRPGAPGVDEAIRVQEN
jgi:hypothetical protein